MMADRHKHTPQAVRMPAGLKTWFRAFAATTRQPLNAVLVTALEEFRQRHDSPAAQPPGRSPASSTRRRRPPAQAPPEEPAR